MVVAGAVFPQESGNDLCPIPRPPKAVSIIADTVPVISEEISMSMVKPLFYILFMSVLLLAGGVSSCTGGQKTTVTTTTVTTPVRADPASANSDMSVETAAARQETTVTTTTTETEKASSPGIVGSAFGLVGAVIAFPFRVVGGVLEALF
jgi:hypothetical protein